MASRVLIANGFLGVYPLIPVYNDSVKQRTEREDIFKVIASIYKASKNFSVFLVLEVFLRPKKFLALRATLARSSL